MNEFITVIRKRRHPINLVMAKAKTEDEWRAEEIEHNVKLSDVVSVTHEYDNFFEVTLSNSPLTEKEAEVFKLISEDPQLRKLV